MNIGGLYTHRDSRDIYAYFEENGLLEYKKLGRLKNNELFVLLDIAYGDSKLFPHCKILTTDGIVGWIRYAGQHLLNEVKT